MIEEIEIPKHKLINWKKVGWYVLPVALLVYGLVVKFGVGKAQLEKDYVAATVSFKKWNQILDSKDKEFIQLDKLVKKHPELQSHYDASVGQGLLAALSVNEASPYIERTIKRTNRPFYADFSKATLKMSQGKYREALQDSLNLREHMLSNIQQNDHSTLFAFNLLRIAILSQRLGAKDQELLAWQELKTHGGWAGEDQMVTPSKHAGFKQLLDHFTVQETSLLDYIQAREEDLKG
ncbi:MAG: hypothetical protein KDK71_01550 [Chlamydiia bacterium]|nr:hypothetical protein [Chlamydiia bacterium]